MRKDKERREVMRGEREEEKEREGRRRERERQTEKGRRGKKRRGKKNPCTHPLIMCNYLSIYQSLYHFVPMFNCVLFLFLLYKLKKQPANDLYAM